MPLTGKERRRLRGLGHGLAPVVHVGKSGLSDSVKSAIDEQLFAHELIKIRRSTECPIDKKALAATIEEALGADIAQALGHTLLVYRANPDDPAEPAPGSDQRDA
jgi:RNA-binding protein